ncbi:MAG: peptidoglycan-binding protein [Cyanobacteria bacterium]|nr:peptidoglycan-binding protein [Cyanobacteriota bacterium]
METLAYTHHSLATGHRSDVERAFARQFAATVASWDGRCLSSAGWTGMLGLALTVACWGAIAATASANSSPDGPSPFNGSSFTDGGSGIGTNSLNELRPRRAAASNEPPARLVDAIDAVTFGIWKDNPSTPTASENNTNTSTPTADDGAIAAESDAPNPTQTASGGGGPIPPQYRTSVAPRRTVAARATTSYSASGLRYGSRSAEVIRLQNRLRELGFFSGRSTGYFGNATLSAVKAFQRSRGLTADGIVGAATLAALHGTSSGGTGGPIISNPCRPRIYSNTGARGIVPDGYSREVGGYGGGGPSYASTACSSCSGTIRQNVTAVQTRLKELGFFHFRVTGYYGPITRNAVIAFQRSRGLQPDGVAGPSTKAALGLNF